MEPLGFGCARIGGLQGPVPEADAAAALAAAWAGGIRYFDAAPLYGAGEGERRLGRFLMGQKRSAYRVSTKVGWIADAGRCRLDYSRDGVLRTVEASLARLGVDRVDALFIHDIDPLNHGAEFERRFAEAMDGALPALQELRRAGIAGAIGVGVNDPAVCLAVLEHAAVDLFLMAGRYTLLDQAAAEKLLPACATRGVRVVIGAPFNTGILATGATARALFRHKPAPPEILARVAAIEEVCCAFGVPLTAAALQFPLGHAAVSTVLPGPRNAAQTRGCVAAMRVAIPGAFWDELKRRGLIPPDAPPAPRERTQP